MEHMEKKTKGAWLVHHTNKLQNVSSQNCFEKTFLSGKAGILLSVISSDNQIEIGKERLDALARASNINIMTELPTLLKVLSDRSLIDVGDSGSISVLGVTMAATLGHTADIFTSLQPNSQENAAIEIAEITSLSPVKSTDLFEEISDKYKLDSNQTNQLLDDSEKIGFLDVEKLNENEKLLFNGNLFRRDTAKKMSDVIGTLSASEQEKLLEVSEMLKRNTCISVDAMRLVLGNSLFNKVIAIGLFDVNVVSNSNEEVGFVTLPSAFSKFSNNSLVDDAFDLAKAFVSSIMYGMTKSTYARGQIQMVERLLGALIRGESIGPVQAIAEDYRILELKGVVQVLHGSKSGRSGPMMRLLKKEVGELALQAIQQGDISEHSLMLLPTASVSNFRGPEVNRERERRTQIDMNSDTARDMLSVLRTGGGI
jgi:hypothetical protein